MSSRVRFNVGFDMIKQKGNRVMDHIASILVRKNYWQRRLFRREVHISQVNSYDFCGNHYCDASRCIGCAPGSPESIQDFMRL
ncbi:hypothetical protein NBRC116589_17590 [Ruegeria sp. HU-ET01832]